MPHVFDAEKGHFVQVHAHKLPARPSKEVKKRQRNAEYVKGLLQKEEENKPLSPEELERRKEQARQSEERRLAAEERRREVAEAESARREAETEAKDAERKKRREEQQKAEHERALKRKEEEQQKAAEIERNILEQEAAAQRKRQQEDNKLKEKEEREAAEKQRREEEAENKRKEQERRAAEEAERKRLEEEAFEKKRQEEDAERKRKEEEERRAAEEAEKKMLEEEAAETKRQEEEAERERKEEEERKAAEDAEKKRLEEEAAETKKQEEEAERVRKEEEERKVAEEAEKKRLEEEAAETKRQEEEAERERKEEEERKAAEEAEKNRLAEETNRKKKEAELKLAEEAERKRQEEEAAEKRRQEEKEAERKRKEDDERKVAAAAEEERLEQQDALEKKRQAEEEEEQARTRKEEERKVLEVQKLTKQQEQKSSTDDKKKDAAFTALRSAMGSGDPEALKKAITAARDTGVPDEALEDAEETLAELEAEETLGRAIASQDIQKLKEAIKKAEAAGLDEDNATLEEAKDALCELGGDEDDEEQEEADEEVEELAEEDRKLAEELLADAAGDDDVEALRKALERARKAGVDADSLAEAEERLAELQQVEQDNIAKAKAKPKASNKEKSAAEEDLAEVAGGSDVAALKRAIERAERLGVDEELLSEARERLDELEAGGDEDEWEKAAESAAAPSSRMPATEASEPAAAPKVSASAYRMFEAEDGAKQMSASAPEFMPGHRGWTVNLAKTNPEAVKARRHGAPEISEASQRMPTYQRKDFILGSVRKNVVTVISGDTGCGKSTLIPQLICDAENLIPDDKVIVCTQPRRIAAITLAQYVAADRRQELGDEVGYQIRFINAFSEHTRLIYATTAIIMRRLHSEPELESIGCLIVDEVHERDVYTDHVLLLIRNAMLEGRMQHLKIVLMSATLKAEDFAGYFASINGEGLDLKPVHVPGRMYPVEDYYWEDACEWMKFCPPLPRAGGGKGKGKKGGSDDRQKPDDNTIWKIHDKIKACDVAKGRPGAERVDTYGEKALVACFCWKENEVYMDLIMDLIFYFHKEQPKGDGAILVFLPGWGDISKAFIELYRSGENFKLIALHSLMTPEQQQEAFERPPKGKRKVVLSTNIAEASVTIDDVVYVIDCGVRKERSYDPTTSVSSLDAKMVSKANAIQRRGRAGRVQEGMVVHLFPSYKMQDLEEFPLPQMLTSSMDEVVLQTMVICSTPVDDIEKMLMGSMAAPKREAIGDAVAGLKKIDCLSTSGGLTALGRACASIPVQPNVAKMLLLAGAFRCIKTASVVAAFLSVKNPFQQSPGQSSGGDKNKKTGKEYFNKGFNSDHLTSLQAYVEWRRAVKAGRGDDFCDDMGLSPETMDMAHMMAQQFTSFMMEAGYDGNDVREEDCPAIRRGSEDDALLRCALVAGFCPNFVALYYGNRSPYWYLCNNQEVYAFGGSVNRDYQMSGKDGDEWMVYSDAMVMGRGHSIMDSSLVFSPFVLLFAKAIMIDEVKGEIRFDNWWANVNPKDPTLKEVLQLRSQVLPKFKEAIEGRDLSMFPQQLTQRMSKVCMSSPIALKNIEPMRRSIDEETTGAARRKLSIFEWPQDEGLGGEED